MYCNVSENELVCKQSLECTQLCKVMWECPLKRSLVIYSTSTTKICSPLVAMPPQEAVQAKMSWWHWPLEELAFLSTYH